MKKIISKINVWSLYYRTEIVWFSIGFIVGAKLAIKLFAIGCWPQLKMTKTAIKIIKVHPEEKPMIKQEGTRIILIIMK